MTVNVLIGVGGTGAKVVESALFLFLAGVGPRNVVVGLVDQDNANGNVVRTAALVNDLVAFRRDWTQGANRLDWPADPAREGVGLGRVAIQPLFGDACLWQPAEETDDTLAKILDRDGMERPEERALFDMLFAPGPEEQDMDLGEGYRGRAHIGSAAMLAALEKGVGGFDRRIGEIVEQAQNEDVRIFLAGSVFGGTGAAGFPTLARAINRIRLQTDETRRRIRLGGALMLPYFGFRNPDDKNANVVRTAELLPQARSALEYYARLFVTEPVYDELYLGGWDPLFHLDYHEAGRGKQKNPPLAPELLAALGAIDFFARPAPPATVPQRAEPGVPFRVSARERAGSLGRADLPFVSRESRDDAYRRLGQLLRFALYWRMEVDPALNQRGLFGLKEKWVRDLTRGVDLKGAIEERSKLKNLFGKALTWAAAMRLFAVGATTFELWNTTGVAVETPDNIEDPIALRSGMSEHELSALYDRLFAPDASDKWRGASELFAELHEPTPDDRNPGLGRLVAAVHHAARPSNTDARHD